MICAVMRNRIHLSVDKGGSRRRDVACTDSFQRFEKLRGSLTDLTPVNGEIGRLYSGNNGGCHSEERVG